jgi:hypothetical protein
VASADLHLPLLPGTAAKPDADPGACGHACVDDDDDARTSCAFAVHFLLNSFSGKPLTPQEPAFMKYQRAGLNLESLCVTHQTNKIAL